MCDPLWAAALGRPPKGDRPRAAAFGGPSEGDRPCAAALGRSLVGGRVLALARGRAPPSGLPDMGAPLTLQMECQMMMVCGFDNLAFHFVAGSRKCMLPDRLVSFIGRFRTPYMGEINGKRRIKRSVTPTGARALYLDPLTQSFHSCDLFDIMADASTQFYYPPFQC